MKIPYYVVRKGRGYWLATPRMKALGFDNIRCGPDGPNAWKIAEEWNRRWQSARKGEIPSPSEIEKISLPPDQSEELAIYPEGSVGFAFRSYRRTIEWSRKKERTREDWWRGWRFIKPIFADVDAKTVTLEMLSQWRQGIEDNHGLNTAHRAMKIWRALWKVMDAYHLCGNRRDPSLAVRNTSPRGRSATFLEGEVVRLAKRAWRQGYRGLACIIAIAWDTQFSPVDVRTLTPNNQQHDNDGLYFLKFRAKREGADTADIEAIGTLSPRTHRLIGAYMRDWLNLLPHAPIFRSRTGKPYSKDTLSRDFRLIRNAEFPGDSRKLMDFRRSGAVEAAAGEVNDVALAAKMANSISSAKRLQDTYLPKRKAVIKSADLARRRGREELRENKESSKS